MPTPTPKAHARRCSLLRLTPYIVRVLAFACLIVVCISRSDHIPVSLASHRRIEIDTHQRVPYENTSAYAKRLDQTHTSTPNLSESLLQPLFQMVQLFRTRRVRHTRVTLESHAGPSKVLACGYGGEAEFGLEQFDRALAVCVRQRTCLLLPRSSSLKSRPPLCTLSGMH